MQIEGYNGRPRRDQGPTYLGSPMFHREIKKRQQVEQYTLNNWN